MAPANSLRSACTSMQCLSTPHLALQEQQRDVMARRLQDAKMRRLKRKQQEMERVSGGASPVHNSHSTASMGGAVETSHHRWVTTCSVMKRVGALAMPGLC